MTSTLPDVGGRRRAAMLAAGTVAQSGSAVTVHGAPFLIPALRDDYGLSLAGAGVVAAAPTFGLVLTLVAWGLVTDRRGERFALLASLSLTVAAGVLAAVLGTTPAALAVLLFLAGAASGGTNAASGRIVVGWFPPLRRGLAMGVRQMAQPAGVGLAALTIPAISTTTGVRAALVVPLVVGTAALLAVAVVVLDPPRPDRTPERSASPYRSSYLPRIHVASALLVVPQFAVWTFALVWLVDDRGWSPAAAGTLVAVAQLLGALGRIAAGQLSDAVRSRLRPLQWVALSGAGVMAALGIAAGAGSAVAVPLVVVAAVVTVAYNGLAYTAVAERAGPFWSGRAMGLQNTGQYLVATAVPPLGGLAVTHAGYAWTFALAGAFAVGACLLVPAGDEALLGQ
ncbi:MFS transporter [Nocardioides marinquilinus]|uniref:MFS transporter n=1 Tax=Nocardioides marinquilinus TaxID=1210400 RepID=A0ABP9QAC4_9ACTN